MLMQAVQVQKAVNDFHAARQRYPTALDELAPEFIPILPSFGASFELTWNPPVVGLSRPGTAKNKQSAPIFPRQ